MMLLAPFFCGCTGLIKLSGKDVSELSTRDQVHEAFGSPDQTTSEKDQTTEYYTTRRKLKDVWELQGMGMGYAMTWGVLEPYWFPRELYLVSRRTVVGQILEFTYDGSGTVKEIRRDGDTVPSWFLDQANKKVQSP
jgi:YD repeat-containing protein